MKLSFIPAPYEARRSRWRLISEMGNMTLPSSSAPALARHPEHLASAAGGPLEAARRAALLQVGRATPLPAVEPPRRAPAWFDQR